MQKETLSLSWSSCPVAVASKGSVRVECGGSCCWPGGMAQAGIMLWWLDVQDSSMVSGSEGSWMGCAAGGECCHLHCLKAEKQSVSINMSTKPTHLPLVMVPFYPLPFFLGEESWQLSCASCAPFSCFAPCPCAFL